MTDERENDQEYADGWTPETMAEYEAYCKAKPHLYCEEYADEQASLPPHKRDGYAERLAEHGDYLRKAQREEMLK